MKKFKIISTILLAFTATFGLFSANVSAENANIQSALIISPMYQKIILIPGETKQMSIKISNPNASTNILEYSVFIGSFNHGTSEDPDQIDTEMVTAYNQIMDWITLEKTTGEVAPNETDVVDFTITVPESAPAGGQYATIIFRDDTSKNTNGANNVNIESTAQMASIIYAEVAGKTINTAEILENNVPSFSFTNKFETTSLVKNTGNVHTDAEYILQVWPIWSNEEICTNEESADTNLIMPGMERYYSEVCTLPLAGIFKAKQTVRIFGEESIVEKTVIVCPIWLLFLVVFAIVAIILWLVMRSKSRKKRAA